MQDFFKQHPNATNTISGAAGGFTTGLMVGFFEAAKIRSQTKEQVKMKHLVSPGFYNTLLKQGVLIPFAFLFSGVCALEFSINEHIKEKHGACASILSSSLTGATFLTVADHLMYKQQTTKSSPLRILKNLCKIHPTAPWTGFSAMTIREAFWISSVTHFGPYSGSYFRALFNGSKDNSPLWDGLGRTTTGMITAILSQPFDVIARTMQKTLSEKPTQKTSFSNALHEILCECRKEKSIRKLYAGGLPRLGLATVGGVLAGGFFDTYKKCLTDADIKPAPPSKHF